MQLRLELFHNKLNAANHFFDLGQGRSSLKRAFEVNADANRAGPNFNNLRFTHGRESLRIALWSSEKRRQVGGALIRSLCCTQVTVTGS
jgi:hypothetical protein